jgi:hypothetical protein
VTEVLKHSKIKDRTPSGGINKDYKYAIGRTCADGMPWRKGKSCQLNCDNGDCLTGSPDEYYAKNLLGGTTRTGTLDENSGASYTNMVSEPFEPKPVHKSESNSHDSWLLVLLIFGLAVILIFHGKNE